MPVVRTDRLHDRSERLVRSDPLGEVDDRQDDENEDENSTDAIAHVVVLLSAGARTSAV